MTNRDHRADVADQPVPDPLQHGHPLPTKPRYCRRASTGGNGASHGTGRHG